MAVRRVGTALRLDRPSMRTAIAADPDAILLGLTEPVVIDEWQEAPETASGTLIGIEVKASASVTASDARHLAWLRDETGDAFAAGIVLHTGPYVFPLGDRLVAAPLSTLWA